MIVRKYVSDSVQEAIAKVKTDLGRDAIILSTKHFKEGGFLGLFARRRVEVVAAVDGDAKPVNRKAIAVNGEVPAMRINQAAYSSGYREDFMAASSQAAPALAMPRPQPDFQPQPKPELQAIHAEIAEMKKLLRQANFQPLVAPIAATVQTPPQTGMRKWKVIRQDLMKLGLTEELIDYLLRKLPKELAEPERETEALTRCKDFLGSKLYFSKPLQMKENQPVLVALVGPTGVGKTTTIAKMAAKFSIFENKKVGLINIDTYRIAAIEHLKTYGEIMKIPVEVVYAPSDLDRAIENLKDCDLILIDTAGRSPRNQQMMMELREFLTYRYIDQIMLVISATTQLSDMMEIEKSFSQTDYTNLIFTKVDETVSLGSVVSLAWRLKRPVAYLTVGQNVPDDIEVAQVDKLLSRLFKESLNG